MGYDYQIDQRTSMIFLIYAYFVSYGLVMNKGIEISGGDGVGTAFLNACLINEEGEKGATKGADHPQRQSGGHK